MFGGTSVFAPSDGPPPIIALVQYLIMLNRHKKLKFVILLGRRQLHVPFGTVPNYFSRKHLAGIIR